MDEFLAATRKLMDDEERAELVEFLSYHPASGVVIQGTGGVRKLRWGLEGRGKRGGARVIYYFHDMDMPLYILEAYAKNERTDLTQGERNELRQVTNLIVESYRRRKEKR
jgi:hypothetical protein